MHLCKACTESAYPIALHESKGQIFALSDRSHHLNDRGLEMRARHRLKAYRATSPLGRALAQIA